MLEQALYTAWASIAVEANEAMDKRSTVNDPSFLAETLLTEVDQLLSPDELAEFNKLPDAIRYNMALDAVMAG